MTETKTPDIEIYVSNLSKDDAEKWLSSLGFELTPAKKGKGQPKSAWPFSTQWQGLTFTSLVFENVDKGFTSVWLDSSELPWLNDLACAKEAAKYFDVE